MESTLEIFVFSVPSVLEIIILTVWLDPVWFNGPLPFGIYCLEGRVSEPLVAMFGIYAEFASQRKWPVAGHSRLIGIFHAIVA